MELRAAYDLSLRIKAELAPFCERIEVVGSIRRARPHRLPGELRVGTENRNLPSFGVIAPAQTYAGTRVHASDFLPGAGVKPGIVCGESGEYSSRPVKDAVHVHDFRATILHLPGLDYGRLIYRHSGCDFHLTDVAGHVVKGTLA